MAKPVPRVLPPPSSPEAKEPLSPRVAESSAAKGFAASGTAEEQQLWHRLCAAKRDLLESCELGMRLEALLLAARGASSEGWPGLLPQLAEEVQWELGATRRALQEAVGKLRPVEAALIHLTVPSGSALVAGRSSPKAGGASPSRRSPAAQARGRSPGAAVRCGSASPRNSSPRMTVALAPPAQPMPAAAAAPPQVPAQAPAAATSPVASPGVPAPRWAQLLAEVDILSAALCADREQAFALLQSPPASAALAPPPSSPQSSHPALQAPSPAAASAPSVTRTPSSPVPRVGSPPRCSRSASLASSPSAPPRRPADVGKAPALKTPQRPRPAGAAASCRSPGQMAPASSGTVGARMPPPTGGISRRHSSGAIGGGAHAGGGRAASGPLCAVEVAVQRRPTPGGSGGGPGTSRGTRSARPACTGSPSARPAG